MNEPPITRDGAWFKERERRYRTARKALYAALEAWRIEDERHLPLGAPKSQIELAVARLESLREHALAAWCRFKATCAQLNAEEAEAERRKPRKEPE